jgi:hypothetical protein
MVKSRGYQGPDHGLSAGVLIQVDRDLAYERLLREITWNYERYPCFRDFNYFNSIHVPAFKNATLEDRRIPLVDLVHALVWRDHTRVSTLLEAGVFDYRNYMHMAAVVLAGVIDDPTGFDILYEYLYEHGSEVAGGVNPYVPDKINHIITHKLRVAATTGSSKIVRHLLKTRRFSKKELAEGFFRALRNLNHDVLRVFLDDVDMGQIDLDGTDRGFKIHPMFWWDGVRGGLWTDRYYDLLIEMNKKGWIGPRANPLIAQRIKKGLVAGVCVGVCAIATGIAAHYMN